MLVDCAIYEDGHRRPGRLTVAEAASLCRDAPPAAANRFVWLGLHQPSIEEFGAVAQAFALHPLAVQEAVHPHQRPKLDALDEVVLAILKPAWYVDPVDVVELGQLAMFVGPNYVITSRHGDSGPLTGARAALEADPNRLEWGPTSVLYTVMKFVVDEYVQVIVKLEQDIDDIENRVFDGARADHGERIFNLKREVLDFRRAVEPLSRPLDQLARGQWTDRLDPRSSRWFGDVRDDLLRVVDHLHNLDSLLDGALAANVAAIGMRQNEDMRKISAGAALVAVPTLIAGVYGMNFDEMPELHWTSGYPLSLGMMVATSAFLYWQFKRRDWL